MWIVSDRQKCYSQCRIFILFMVKQRNAAVQILISFSYKINKSGPYTADLFFLYWKHGCWKHDIWIKSFNFFRVNNANIRISGVRNIYLTQKPLRKWTFKPGWWTDYLIGWNIICILTFAYALCTFISHMLIFSHAVFETLIYSMENTRYIF